MLIEIGIKPEEPEKNKGSLLERIVKKFLSIQQYEITTNMNMTGMELDLLCTYIPNRSKEIYVECKAYGDKKIQANAVKNLIGIKNIKDYKEAWLIATSEFGGDAKGLIDEIKKGKNSPAFTFFTAEDLISAFIRSGVIKDGDLVEQSILSLIKEDGKLGSHSLLITDMGDFWVYKYLVGGKENGLIFAVAKNGEIVKEKKLLENLKSLNISFQNLDFFSIFKFEGQKDLTVHGNERFEFKKEYSDQSNELGVKLIHPEKEELFLDDIFIYPNLELMDKEEREIINSKKIIDLDLKYNRCVIVGEDVSGKSSLAKMLQKELNAQDMIALYLLGREIKHSDFNKFSNLLAKKFKEQYGYGDENFYKNFDKFLIQEKAKIFIIIDEFEELGVRIDPAKIKFFDMIKEKFDYTLIFSNDSIEIETMAKTETIELLKDFKKLRIKQFGHVLRDELIERWLTVENENISEKDLNAKKIEMSQKLKIIIGTNFLPTYPLYLLTILQCMESNNKLQGSSYAEFYRYLINYAFGATNINPDEWDFYHTYLSHFAHYLFVSRTKKLPKEEMIKMYDDYLAKMALNKPFDRVHGLLIKAKILNEDSVGYYFNHNYSYYFFVAKYFSDNFGDPEIKKEVQYIIQRLYWSEFANIIIFFIHHSKNKDIIGEIINESKKIFNNIQPYTLSDEDLQKINGLIHEEITLSLEGEDLRSRRRKELEEEDKIDENNKKISDKKDDDYEQEKTLDLFDRVNLSFKLIEILGQITNNYYGSLDGQQKLDIVDELYSIGFRGLRALLEDFEKYIDSIRIDILNFIEKKKFSLKTDKERVADKIILRFIEMLVFVFIKRISSGIASKNLFLTVQELKKMKNSPAAELFNMAVKLNFATEFNTDEIIELDKNFGKNLFVKTLLKVLVAEHLYKFESKFSDKQSVCDRLGIDIKKIQQGK